MQTKQTTSNYTTSHSQAVKSNHSPLSWEGTEKVKSTFRLKVNGGEIVVLPFFFCLT